MLSFQVLADSPVNNFWLLGDSFLRSTYSIYDVTNNKIGFVADFAQSSYPALSPLTSLLPLLMCCCCIGGVVTAIIVAARAVKNR